MTEDKDRLEDELSSIKKEMQELKEMLKAKKSEVNEEIHVGGPDRPKDPETPDPPKSFRIEIDSDYEGVDDTLNDYLGSVMEGVAHSLSQSMKQMTRGFSFNLEGIDNLKDIGKEVSREVKRAQRDLEREGHRIKRDMKRMKRDAKRKAKVMGKEATVLHLRRLKGEELDRFYEVAPNLTAALSDEKKLKLLKVLEEGPMYQKDLSDQTGIKGGTFKHHMDSLIEFGYVYQEQTRGRYLIKQLGVEALKLSEMLFRRYMAETGETFSDDDYDEDFDDQSEGLDDEIDSDINDEKHSVDTMTDSQNDEEEG